MYVLQEWCGFVFTIIFFTGSFLYYHNNKQLIYKECETLLGFKRIEKEKPVENKKQQVPYQDKYKTKFDALFIEDPVKTANDTDPASYKNNKLIEQTPAGNIIMYYDASKESFVYYSDNTIPYRYLETAARKYAITFRCPHLYIVMDDVLKEAEEKKRAQFISPTSKEPNQHTKEEKKNVFAKFKSYNKQTSKAAANIPSKNQSGQKTKEQDMDVIVKERANRYTWEGKFLDCQLLQKVDKTKTNKRLALSFADFKSLRSTL